MTAPTTRRLSLPLFTRVHEGGRSAMTCKYRCGDACAQPVPNTSDNLYFGDIVAEGASRRAVLKGASATAALLGLVGIGATTNASPAAAAPVAAPPRRKEKFGALNFTPIAPVPASTDRVTVPQGWKWEPIISWGDPISPAAPDFDFDNQTPAAQRAQAGYNADYVAILPRAAKPGKFTPAHKQGHRGVLVFNNEYTNDELMFRGVTSADDLTVEQLEIIMAAHGMTIVEVTRAGARSPWRYLRDGKLNRRLHTHTPFSVDGPAAGSRLLRTSADPRGTMVLGTLNNCAGGTTPWGTVLSGEENFNQYFKADQAPAEIKPQLARYGITSSGRGWERADARFDVAVEPNEPNRFGWIVEVDPHDPNSTPVKHTALGRFKHEGASTVIAPDGRVVVYMGDDERFDYVYRFVSRDRFRPGGSPSARAHNKTLLSAGDLDVARYTGDGMEDGVCDGTGEWIPLTRDGKSMVPGMSVDEVLVYTRIAADKVAATKMDRPEDMEVNPVNGRIYLALTNNTKRVPSQIDEANPRANNKYGHVIEMKVPGGDHTAGTFSWKIVLIAGNPSDPTTYFNGYDKSEVTPISCPDNVTFDRKGNLWISTDGQPGTLNHCDGLFMMPVDGPEKGRLVQFLAVPVGAETCGPFIVDDHCILVAVQHPGEVDGASPANVVSRYPYLGDGQPRPGVLGVYSR